MFVVANRDPANRLLTAKSMRWAIKRKLYVFVMSENLVKSSEGIKFNIGEMLDSVEEELVDRKLEKVSKTDSAQKFQADMSGKGALKLCQKASHGFSLFSSKFRSDFCFQAICVK